MGEAITAESGGARERRLVARAQQGDVDAYSELIKANQDSIFGAIYHLVGNKEDAEDIAQEVFLKAYRGIRRFRGAASFSTWLYGIMLNCVRTHWRRATHAVETLDGDADGRHDPPAPGGGPEEEALRRERIGAVRRAIAGLDEEAREVVVLRDIRGLSYEEMAAAIGAPVGTVKSRLHRARQALKTRLAPLLGGSEFVGNA